ncbi:hypothetical protein N7540_006546 [Penicillium herquei]|nr:hypothetical protein N7540_006546 [Penicillium herquei]
MTSHTIPGDWERAPKDYDWYQDTKVSRTQADNLPQGEIRATLLAKKLTAPHDYGDWQRQVKTALTNHGLIDLIDFKVDRPKMTDIKGERWKQCSLGVAMWLKQNTAPNVIKELEQKHRRFIFADEVFHAIETHMDCASPHADAERLALWEKMSVTDFLSTSNFIDEVLLAMKRLNDRHMVMSPYEVLMKILYGVGVNDDDIKTWFCSDWVSQKKDPKTFTVMDLEKMVERIKQSLPAELEDFVKPELGYHSN